MPHTSSSSMQPSVHLSLNSFQWHFLLYWIVATPFLMDYLWLTKWCQKELQREKTLLPDFILKGCCSSPFPHGKGVSEGAVYSPLSYLPGAEARASESGHAVQHSSWDQEVKPMCPAWKGHSTGNWGMHHLSACTATTSPSTGSKGLSPLRGRYVTAHRMEPRMNMKSLKRKQMFLLLSFPQKSKP